MTTPIHHLLLHELLHALGWTLLNFCWQGAAVAIMLWSALQILGARSAQARYLATCIALALMVLLPLATFATLARSGLDSLHTGRSLAVVAIVVDARAGASHAPLLERLAAAFDPFIPWMLRFWLAGAVLCLVRLQVGLSLTRRMRHAGISAVTPVLARSFATVQRRLGVTRAVTLVHSALVEVPTVLGWLRPLVLLPLNCCTGLTAEQVEAILAHELAHIRRHDFLVSVLQSVMEALLFYHPAVWWVSRQMRSERECCCDQLAVAATGDALLYARALSILEVQRSTYPQLALGANGGVLIMRIARLLNVRQPATQSLAAPIFILLLLASSAVAVGASARAESKPAPAVVFVASPAPAPFPAPQPGPAPAAKPALRPEPAPSAGSTASTAIVEVAPSALQQNGPARIAGGVMAGAILTKTQPVYPDIARAAHVSGAVVLHAIISPVGEVVNLQVISGPEMLRASALEAVRNWTYQPYLLNGEPTAVETTITVNYSFGEDPNTAQNADAPKQIGGSVSAPVVLYTANPEYTNEARQAKLSGAVLVRLEVDSAGMPTNVRVVRGIGKGLDEKAVEAVEQYRFKPAMEDGRPVTVEMNIEVNFQVF